MPHNCPICPEQFSSEGAVRDHTWEVHEACHYCGKTIVGDQNQLYRHWLSAHPQALSKVDSARASATVDSVTFRDRLSEGGVSAAISGMSRRSAMLAGGSALAGIIAGGGMVIGGDAAEQPASEASSTQVSGPVASAPVPPNPAEKRYATMGTDEADTTVTYFGSWKCPYCAKFSTGFFKDIVKDYVVTGDINVRFRNIAYLGGKPFIGPDAPNAGHAGLAVWNNDSASYWPYHEYVFRNQPPEREQWATASKLASFAQASNVEDPQAIKEAVQSNKYENALRATSDAAQSAGVRGTPSLLVDGTLVSPFEKEQTRNRIEDAISA